MGTIHNLPTFRDCGIMYMMRRRTMVILDNTRITSTHDTDFNFSDGSTNLFSNGGMSRMINNKMLIKLTIASIL